MNIATKSVALLAAVVAIILNTVAVANAAELRVLNYRNGGTGAFPDADPPLEWSNGSRDYHGSRQATWDRCSKADECTSGQ
jgi:hypothetical protein